MGTLPVSVTLLLAALWGVTSEPHVITSSATLPNLTSSSSMVSHEHALRNGTDPSVGSRISSIMTHLPALKNGVILVCGLTAALITCLLIKVIRSGKRMRKTRKYDIITTPAERVEMAPLNEDHDDEDDSTLFNVKYR
ncbi:membrane protein FAM174B [Gouania willdenowi]|uniref:Membrane protein FAM174B-like n=1 Tax=Gouania willdenowi TaxID=441366 RepID=A0A8C5DNV4_GOUWI|nr:membrane protein FAM174B-like [Gouania willdenowi]